MLCVGASDIEIIEVVWHIGTNVLVIFQILFRQISYQVCYCEQMLFRLTILLETLTNTNKKPEMLLSNNKICEQKNM